MMYGNKYLKKCETFHMVFIYKIYEQNYSCLKAVIYIIFTFQFDSYK
jgi:hypothetical protein